MRRDLYVPSTSPSRLRLLFESFEKGPEILVYLMTLEAITGMIAATDRSEPAVVGISSALIRQFGEAARSDNAKRAIGAAVRWLMEENGYEVDTKGRKTPLDPLFSTGTKYRLRWVPNLGSDGVISNPHPAADTINRLVLGLDSGELRLLIGAAQNELNRIARFKPFEGNDEEAP